MDCGSFGRQGQNGFVCLVEKGEGGCVSELETVVEVSPNGEVLIVGCAFSGSLFPIGVNVDGVLGSNCIFGSVGVASLDGYGVSSKINLHSF